MSLCSRKPPSAPLCITHVPCALQVVHMLINKGTHTVTTRWDSLNGTFSVRDTHSPLVFCPQQVTVTPAIPLQFVLPLTVRIFRIRR